MCSTSSKFKMLIADDSFPIRTLLSDAFSSDFEIILAENGEKAIDVLDHVADISIALVDMKMPVCDGQEVLEHIFGSERLCCIPVIALASEKDEESQVRALDMGAVDVLTKPVKLRLAQHRVRNIIARESVGSEQGSADGGVALKGVDSSKYKTLFHADDIDIKSGAYTRANFCRKTRLMLDANPKERYVLFRFDIDGFKVLNDVYGVVEGDYFLRQIADMFRDYVSRAGFMTGRDIVYGRWDADHFVACMKLDDFNRYHVAEFMNKPISSNRVDFESVPRMGVFVIEDPKLDVALMADRACLALKSIKGNYTRRVAFYDDTMRKELIESQSIVSEMTGALESGQFIIYLQPQFNYASGKLHGAEALVRWKHPIKGIIPPIKFIPIFEKNGFISHLDEFVWEEACKLQRKWLDMGLKIVPISVNVSRTDISSMKLCDFFIKLIDKYHLNPDYLRIEITESAYMDNPGLLINAVEKLQKAGFSVEMDDFGSGYSSLNTLKDVPVDMLKLDMKFIEDNSKSNRGGSILSSVVRMSNWLKLPVLAEGVETKNQADFLKSIGCIYMQGYYFARPLPVSEFEKLLIAAENEELQNRLSIDNNEFAYEFLNASTQATLLFNSFVGGAGIIEYDGKDISAMRMNDKFFETIGVSREDFIRKGKDITSDFDEENFLKLKKAIENSIKTGDEDSVELVSHTMIPGEDVWTLARVKMLTENSGKYLVYLTIENISEAKRLYERNERLSERLTGIINNVPGGVFDLILSNGKAEFTFVNDKFSKMFGYTQKQYEKKFYGHFEKAIHPQDYNDLLDMFRLMVKGDIDNICLAFRHICKDGEYKCVNLYAGVKHRDKKECAISAVVLES